MSIVAPYTDKRDGRSLMERGLQSVLDQLEAPEQIDRTMEEFIAADLGVTLTPKQVEIVRAVQTHRRVAVKSCHGSGKTHAAACLILAFLHCFPMSKVITTASTGFQVKEVLWQQIRGIHAAAPGTLYGPCLTTKLEVKENWFALGFKPDEKHSGRFHGFHAPHVLLVVDEAAELELATYNALNSLMTSENCTILLIGNPTETGTPFYQAFTKNKSIWKCITIRAEDTPNIQAGFELIPGLLSQQWIDDAIAEHGADSDYVRARVHAEFPKNADSAYISQDDLEAAQSDPRSVPNVLRVEIGLDVARFGSDSCALVARSGGHVQRCVKWSKVDTMDTVGRVRAQIDEVLAAYGARRVWSLKVDLTGVGTGVYDRLEELRLANEIPVDHVVPVEFGGSPNEKGKFDMCRSEMWWWLRERFEQRTIWGTITDELVEDVSGIRAEYRSSYTHPVVENKAKQKARIGHSPDVGDAYCLAFWNPTSLLADGVSVLGTTIAGGSVFHDFAGDTPDDEPIPGWSFGVSS